jgi:hypothetical protein
METPAETKLNCCNDSLVNSDTGKHRQFGLPKLQLFVGKDTAVHRRVYLWFNHVSPGEIFMGLSRQKIVVCGAGGFIGGRLKPGPQEKTRSKSAATASRLAALCISTNAVRP